MAAVTVLRRSPAQVRTGRPWRRGLGAIAVLSAFVATAGLGGTRPAWYLPIDFAVVLTGVVGLGLGLVGKIRVRWHWMYLPVFAVLALPLLQLRLGTTADRSATETAFLALLASAFAFWLAAQASDDRRFVDALVRCLAVAGGVLAVFGLAQRLLSPDAIYGAIRIQFAYPMGPFINHNDYVAALELLFPASLALAFRGRDGRGVGWGWIWVAGVELAAAAISQSRGGAIGLGVEILLAAFFLRSRHSHGHSRRRGVWSVPGTVAAGIMVVFVIASGVTPLVSRFRHSEVSGRARLQLDRSSVSMGEAKPVWGQGLGTWATVYPAFARFDDGLIYDASHCEYAQWWAETGLVGCALALWALISFGLATAPGWRDRLTAPLLIGLTGFCVHATVDFLWHIPALALLFAVVAGGCLLQPSPPRRSPSHV